MWTEDRRYLSYRREPIVVNDLQYHSASRSIMSVQQTKLILITIIAVTLFLGGLILFFLKIAFWSLFLGIPAIQIGIVFLIYAFDKVSSAAADTEDQEEIREILEEKKGK